MAFTLKGERYRKPHHAELARFIVDELPYLDYLETLRFYDLTLPNLDVDGSALLGCNDRFYLLTGLLGRHDVIHPWLFDRCREVEADPWGYLDLWAREHYKSTIITFAGIIQETLVDPELTHGIFSHSRGISAKFLSQIMQEFERNDGLKATYPDVLWEKPRSMAPVWSLDGGITVKRKSNPKEATVEAWGLVDGQPTSKHFARLWYDDVVTDKSVTTPEMVKKTTEAWELSDNLGAGDVRKATIGTRYSFADTYGVMIERKVFKERIYPATDNGKITGKPVFMSVKRWEEKKRTQRSTLAAQMLQNPLAGQENVFRAEWLRPYEIRPRALNVYIMGDPSKGKSKTSDRTAFAVVGVDVHDNRYLLDGYRHRMSLSERWSALKLLYKKWTAAPGVQSVSVGYERYGQQSDDEHFQHRMQEEEFSFPIEELSWTRDGKESKRDRVERLEPDFRNGKFFLPSQVWEPIIGDCWWRIDVDKSHVVTQPIIDPKKPKAIQETKAMREARLAGASELIARPIIRKDEDGKPYDVTRALMEEMLFFPFAPKDDFVDALSRIHDMNAVPPTFHEETGPIEQPEYEDT